MTILWRILAGSVFFLVILSILNPVCGEDWSKLVNVDYMRHPYGVLPRDHQHVTPVRDNPEEPFDWYRNPRCVIGVYGGPEETLITGDGAVVTDFATLRFYGCEERTPISKRVKTFHKGYLPLVRMDVERDGIRYESEYFTGVVNGMEPVSYSHTYGLSNRTLETTVENMVNFLQLAIHNSSDSVKEVNFGVGILAEGIPEPPEVGILSPPKKIPGLAKSMGYHSGKRMVTGNGKMLCTVSGQPAVIDTLGETGELILHYRVKLKPGERQQLHVKLPYFLAPEKDGLVLQNADYDRHRRNTIEFWEGLLKRKASVVEVGESKVENTYKAGIIYSLIDCLDILDGKYFFHDNPTIYDKFWIRGSALNFRGMELAGFGDVVGKALMIYLDWQADDGEFVGKHPKQWDGHGQAMWALGHHFSYSGDTTFARKVFPAVRRGMEWQWQFRKDAWEESGGLMPNLHMEDDEGVHGHLVGYNLWAIAGAKGAIALAKGVGEGELAHQWEERTREYERILVQRCQEVFQDLGVVPPALEGLEAKAIRSGWYGGRYGLDWGNMMLVYPSEVFHPQSEMVTGSVNRWRQMTFEGVMTYPQGGRESYLHSYTPFYISETYIHRDDQWEATRDLYNHLVHSSSTHMAAEGMNAAGRWGWIPETPAMPHGEFSGKYLSLIRDFLAVEWKDTLHIARALSPGWLDPGNTLHFKGPTSFGPMEYTMTLQESGMNIRFEPQFRKAPKSVVVHAPQHTEITGVTINGEEISRYEERSVSLDSPGREMVINVQWRVRENPPALSYSRAVEDYLLNYRKMVKEPSLELQDNWSLSTSEPDTGEECIVSATVINSGGAGFPTDTVALFVNGERIKSAPRELKRGIGFDSPAGIISFRPNREGKVTVTFPVTWEEPGTYEVSVGLGRGGDYRKLAPKTVVVKSK